MGRLRCSAGFAVFLAAMWTLWAVAVPAAGPADDVGYSTDASGTPADTAASAPEDSGAAPARPGNDAAAPPINITIDSFNKAASGRETPSQPAPKQAEPGLPSTGAMRPEPSAGSQTAPAKDPGAWNRASPVAAMLESTRRGDYAKTRAIRQNMPKKAFSQTFDKAGGAAYSRIGNEQLNKRNDLREALKAYETAYAHDRSSSEINGSYGYALFLDGRFEEARDKEIESLEISPGYTPAWFVLGQVFGYLRQQEDAYASFVTSCLFTKNSNTTLGFLEREKDKYGSPDAQAAAARALETCRRLASPEAASDAQAPARPTAMAPPGPDRNQKIGMIDPRTIVFGSRQFQAIMAGLGRMRFGSEAERTQRLEALVVPLITDIRDLTRRYAAGHGYAVVIQAGEEGRIRHEPVLRVQDFPLVNADRDALSFLNSPPGREYRKSVPIDDLTPVVAGLLNGR